MRTSEHKCGPSQVVVSVPTATSIVLSLAAREDRLTPPDNDARFGPMSVPVYSALQVMVHYTEGNARDLTLDARVNYTVNEEECAEIVLLDNERRLAIKHSAACTWVTVSAVFDGSLAHSVPVAVVVVKDMWINFYGYSANWNVVITELGLVQCTTDTYHHATARASIQLSDHGEGQKVYNLHKGISNFESNDTAVAEIRSQNRVFVKGPGSLKISATFRSTQTKASASLVVVNEVLAFVKALTMSTSLYGSPRRTVRRIVDESQPTTVAITFDNDVTLPDVAKSDWVDVESVISFSSDDTDTISIDTAGTITLHNNAPSLTSLRAELACDSSKWAPPLTVAANLDPAPFDVDFGREYEWQFEPSGDRLAVDVRIRTPAGQRLINFQVICDFDVGFLTSDGAHKTDTGWSGVTDTLNDPPSSFQLVGNDVASERKNLVSVGRITLVVLQAGVTLITGKIQEIITVDAAGGSTRVEETPVFAGQGYASLSLSRRSRLLSALPGEHAIGHPTPRRAAEARRSRQRALQSCSDPCDAQRVWGDVTADCKFTSADVLEMSTLATKIADYLAGTIAEDPLEDKCPWVKRQARDTPKFI